MKKFISCHCDDDDDKNDDLVYFNAFDNLGYEGALYGGTDSEDELCDASENKSNSFEFGPHRKFSRGDEKYIIAEELKMATKNGLFVPWICYLVYLQGVAKLHVVLTPQM